MTTDDSGRSPLRRVTMTLTGDRSGVRVGALTDDGGRFAFTSLPADRYTLSAAKAGYLPVSYGSKRPGGSGTPIVVSDGQQVTVAMTLLKGSVLSGIVRDERGAPMPDVSVAALRYVVSSETGQRELREGQIGSSILFPDYATDAWPGTATTDDRGVYRIYGLAPGDYVVAASVRLWVNTGASETTDVHQVSRADVQRAQQLLRAVDVGAPVNAQTSTTLSDTTRVNYAPVYHPNAIASADATIVTLGRSEERSGVDVTVKLVPTATLTGGVSRPDGTPVSNASLNLREIGPSASLVMNIRLARSGADGTFAIPGLNPGRYQLLSYTYADGHSGTTMVEIMGRDVSTSAVLMPGGAISGRLVFDGALKPPAPTSVNVGLYPPVLGSEKYNMSPDGTFTMSGIPSGKYQLRLSGRPPAGWMMRSAMLNGVDVSDIPFEIRSNETIEGAVVTLTDRGAEVSGRFLDAAGKPAPEYLLVVFSADRRFWMPRSRRTQVVRPDANGTFVARDLPPGDYLISAVTDLEDNQWNDPEFLSGLAATSPIRITLAEGEKKVQDIRVGGS